MKRTLAVAGVALGALLVQPALAWEGDTFRPFVSLGQFYDSNLFRLSDSANSSGIQRDDRYRVLSGGLNVDWKPGRQQLVASATKTFVRYDRNTFLDYQGNDVQATWNWRLGNRLSGNLGATETTGQSSFGDIGVVNNKFTRKRRFGRADWEFHPRWRIGAGVEETDNANSAPSQFVWDYHQTTEDVTLGYQTPKGSRLRAQVRRIDASFPNQQILQTFLGLFAAVADNSYEQTEYNLLGDWSLSGKLTLHWTAGWVDRRYDNMLQSNIIGGYYAALEPRSDFSGFNGRVTADWYATGKTLFSMSLYQELAGAQDINATSVLKKGASVNGAWLIREKWRLNAGVTFENRDFRGDMGAGLPQRTDDTWGTSLSVNYAPIQAVSIDLGVSSGRRDSNTSVYEYTFNSAFVNVRADF
ncbi:MAG: hypothetical protein ABS92_01140 [Thiobacillus sp. SCN 63-374]|nr:MAG: hypothetical protein ABS92_01140 [Thiobacillus sp. SCN 63-374]